MLEPRAFRLMRADGNLPALGETASTLGIRVPKGQFTRVPVDDLLVLAPDRADHGVIEPAAMMSLQTYKTAITGTQSRWEIDEP